jgi:hypothetical protein
MVGKVKDYFAPIARNRPICHDTHARAERLWAWQGDEGGCGLGFSKACYGWIRVLREAGAVHVIAGGAKGDMVRPVVLGLAEQWKTCWRRLLLVEAGVDWKVTTRHVAAD